MTELATTNNPLMAVLSDPERLQSLDVDKLERLAELHMQMQDREAKRAFSEAFNAVQGEMVPVVKRGLNKHQGSTYARHHDVDRMLQPLIAKHGFSLSFSTEDTESKDMIRYVMVVRHKGGHSERHTMELPKDDTGKKAHLHQIGSSNTYGKRYLKVSVFDVDLSDDDDGNAGAGVGPSAETITEHQAADLRALIEDVGADKAKFLRFFGIKNVLELPASRMKEAVRMLEARRSRG